MKSATIIGAGVIGLTTAIVLQSLDYEITIYADSTWDKNKDQRQNSVSDPFYVSNKAGAIWFSYADDDELQLQEWDRISYLIFDHLAKYPHSITGILKRKGSLYYTNQSNYIKPWWYELAKATVISTEDLPEGISFGISYETYTIDCPKYLEFLTNLLVQKKGFIQYKHVHNIQDFVTETSDKLTINCTGLGSKSIVGVDDHNLSPSAGLSMIFQIPFNKFNEIPLFKIVAFILTLRRQQYHGFYIWNLDCPNGKPFYCIPRASGMIVLGGSYDIDCWTTNPNPEVVKNIIQKCLQFFPKTLGKIVENVNVSGPFYDGVEILVGLRPTRSAGIRCQKEEISLAGNGKRSSPLIHHYGHGKYGYTTSWGSAMRVAELADDLLNISSASKIVFAYLEQETGRYS